MANVEIYSKVNGKYSRLNRTISVDKKVNGTYTPFGYDIYVKSGGKYVAPTTSATVSLSYQIDYISGWTQYLGPLFKTGGRLKIFLNSYEYFGSVGGYIDVFLCNRRTSDEIQLAGINVGDDHTYIGVGNQTKASVNHNKAMSLNLDMYMDNTSSNYIRYKTTSSESGADNLSGSFYYNVQANNGLYLKNKYRTFGAVSRTVCRASSISYYL